MFISSKLKIPPSNALNRYTSDSIHLFSRGTWIVPKMVRSIGNIEIRSEYKRHKPKWMRDTGSKPGYPYMQIPENTRIVGVDENLQERIDELFKNEKDVYNKRTDIGFPHVKVETPANNRAKMIQFRKELRSNKELEKAARLRKLEVTLDQVKSEHLASGSHYREVFEAAELYGVFEDLYGTDKFFRPCVDLKINYDFDDEYVTPVYRGNLIKPKEATTAPTVKINPHNPEWSKDSLWTLVLTNLDGHFTDEDSEYLHWMVANIPGNDFKSGKTVTPYLQPFPAFGTGYQRHVFVLYKQTKELDLSAYHPSSPKVSLAERTFKTKDFMSKFEGELTPAGLAFFQSDYDSTLKAFYHNVLEMREPKFEYNFIPEYIEPWLEEVPGENVPFNFFLDKMRDPKEIQEEVLKKKLKTQHPLKGDLNNHIKFPNAHGPQTHRYQDQNVYGAWRLREMERERLRQGVFKDMDWTHLRRDPVE